MHLSEEEFIELVGEALDGIPERFTAAMDNVVVLVEDEHPGEPGLLGLYHGIALTERTIEYGGALPDRITIYRLPILARCATPEEVVREVRITVVHEIAHHFGIDDDTLHDYGWA
ncbi:metallopeptidase family protein [Sciscionella marina]|uniref:metallopeptidase family protein n=1 Tax=Sciscionella marina TaxID=508770 RepID=UPI0003A0B2D1|nr:metallopeptidase family protein [Sciscionella marina]